MVMEVVDGDGGGGSKCEVVSGTECECEVMSATECERE